ncbi:MAG: hypothetical protein SGPRY_009785 [Prymnesium sp.]
MTRMLHHSRPDSARLLLRGEHSSSGRLHHPLDRGGHSLWLVAVVGVCRRDYLRRGHIHHRWYTALISSAPLLSIGLVPRPFWPTAESRGTVVEKLWEHVWPVALHLLDNRCNLPALRRCHAGAGQTFSLLLAVGLYLAFGMLWELTSIKSDTDGDGKADGDILQKYQIHPALRTSVVMRSLGNFGLHAGKILLIPFCMLIYRSWQGY